MQIEVAYAKPDDQAVLEVTLPAGATVEEAIRASGILERFPEIDLSTNKVGIYGKLTRLDAPLRDRDRVEIYRPLIADPRAARRRRAAGSA
nr:RnfH family protein [Ectothiorhodospira mobilis]